jgi:hypothetical protein
MALRMYALAIIASVAAAIATSFAATAYEPASRQRGSYRMVVDSNLECIEIPDGGVTILAHGFLINELSEFVPEDQSQPSTDGRFWRCDSAGRRTFVLVPLDRY